MIELRFIGKFGVQLRAGAARRASHHFRQTVIGLGTQHDVHMARTTHDLRALCLGDASGNRDDRGPTGFAALLLGDFQAAQFREQFFGSLFPDMAGVDDHHIGRLRRIHGSIAQGRQDIRHAGGVVHVHLAAIGLDEEVFRQNLSASGVRGAQHAQQFAAVDGMAQV